MSNNSSTSNNFVSTFSSIAYEHLTGNKLPPPPPPPTSSQQNSNGTSHWAVGMANAGDVLGNLGMTSAGDLGDTARNTTWDIPVPPHTYGSVHRNKETLPDYTSHSTSKKVNLPQCSTGRANTDRKNVGTTTTTANTGTSTIIVNNLNCRGSSSKSSRDGCDANTSPKLTHCDGSNSDVYIGDTASNLYTTYPMQEKLYPTPNNLSSPLTPSKPYDDYGDIRGSSVKEYRKHDLGKGLCKPTAVDSRASTPSSNSNSLTKKKSTKDQEPVQDRDTANSSPYFHLTKNGLDQLEVLSDSGDSSSPDTASERCVPDTGGGDGADLDVGSMVEIVIRDVARFGVIRWLGNIPGDKKEGRTVAGVELEDGTDGLSDGTFDGLRHFSCAAGKAIFVNLNMCCQDSRFLESLHSSNSRASIAFGCEDLGPVSGRVAPPDDSTVQDMMGRNKGIQGHQNSCYLDATLFSMFAFTSVFDSLLFRPATASDINEYNEVQEVLREEIVNPLRSRMFVRADRIMKLRTLLDHLSSVRGLTTEEKDPEEFLHSLLAQILKADPYLQLSSGQEAYHYQLFLEKGDKVGMPSVQHLFDQSFLTSDIKLKQVPSILILQMPRFGKDYKMFPRILPSLLLDVTDVIEDSPRQCFICGQVAEFECSQCFGQCGTGLESSAFCSKCISNVHSHKKRDGHRSVRPLRVPPEYSALADRSNSVPRVYMELFAVVCIETSHYVTFTRCGQGPDAPWCFFDSMADRKGEQNGYNIPSVVQCGELLEWLGEKGSQTLNAVTDDKALPDLTRRLLCDAYMCFYQSSKVAMYR